MTTNYIPTIVSISIAVLICLVKPYWEKFVDTREKSQKLKEFLELVSKENGPKLFHEVRDDEQLRSLLQKALNIEISIKRRPRFPNPIERIEIFDEKYCISLSTHRTEIIQNLADGPQQFIFGEDNNDITMKKTVLLYFHLKSIENGFDPVGMDLSFRLYHFLVLKTNLYLGIAIFFFLSTLLHWDLPWSVTICLWIIEIILPTILLRWVLSSLSRVLSFPNSSNLRKILKRAILSPDEMPNLVRLFLYFLEKFGFVLKLNSRIKNSKLRSLLIKIVRKFALMVLDLFHRIYVPI